MRQGRKQGVLEHALRAQKNDYVFEWGEERRSLSTFYYTDFYITSYYIFYTASSRTQEFLNLSNSKTTIETLLVV